MAEEYIGFEEALRRLKLEDAQLKRLISENEIKAYRDSGSMKLKKDDVERLHSRLSGGSQTEELVFEDDETANEPGMATVPLSEAPTMTERSQKKPAPAKAAAPAARKAAPAEKEKAAPAPPRKRKEIPVEVGGEPVWVKAILCLTVVVMVVAVFAAFDSVKGQAGSISSALPGVMPKTAK